LDALNRPQCRTEKPNGRNTLSPGIAAIGQAAAQPKAIKEGKKIMGDARNVDIETTKPRHVANGPSDLLGQLLLDFIECATSTWVK
jgi:hypothetical protein